MEDAAAGEVREVRADAVTAEAAAPAVLFHPRHPVRPRRPRPLVLKDSRRPFRKQRDDRHQPEQHVDVEPSD